MTNKPALPVVRFDDQAELGPAMRALPNDRWRAFVAALVQTGCAPADAAKLAGFQGADRNALAWTGRRLAHDPRVQAALHEEAIKVLRVDGIAALKFLREIAADKQTAHRDRLKAIDMILSRGGFAAVTQRDVNVVHKSDDQLRTELLAMGEELGLDAASKAKLIGVRTIDAEFTVVANMAPAEPPTPRPPQKRAPRGETPEEASTRRQRVREERRERMQREYAQAQAGRLGLEDLLPELPELTDPNLNSEGTTGDE